jgi:hypothetical protein
MNPGIDKNVLMCGKKLIDICNVKRREVNANKFFASD